MSSNTEQILIVFVALTGAAVILQACVLLAIFISLRKAAKSALQATEDLKATVVPTVIATRELVDRISPQVVSISAGLADLTNLLKRESHGVSLSAAEIMGRVNRQTERLDGMLTTGLDAVERAGAVVEASLAVPVRQANGVVAAIKAMVNTYRSVTPQRRPVEGVRGFDPEI